MSDEAEDPRTLLRTADDLMRRERYDDAVALYLRTARVYARLGFALKAIAVARQVVQIADREAPALNRHLGPALRLLLATYGALGLDADALEVEARLTKIEPPS